MAYPEYQKKRKKSNTFQDYWKDTNTNAKYQAENTEQPCDDF